MNVTHHAIGYVKEKEREKKTHDSHKDTVAYVTRH